MCEAVGDRIADKCWASSLGGCSNSISREHLVSHSLFIDGEIIAQGLPWCKDQPKRIGLANLTAKILCTHHNSMLSPVDDAGSAAFAAIRKMRDLGKIRGKMRPTLWHVVRYAIDGPGLERWFLKTLINLTFEGDYPIGRESAFGGCPTEHLVEVAYGRRKFEGRAGLYSVAHPGMTQVSSETISFTPLRKHGIHVEGALFGFSGFIYLLFLEKEGPPPRLTGISFCGEDLGKSQLNFHNEQATMMAGRYRSQILATRWWRSRYSSTD